MQVTLAQRIMLKDSIHSCFVFENMGEHRVIAQSPELPPLSYAEDILGSKSFATFFRLLGTERVFCVQGKFGPMLILCPAERKVVSIAVVLEPRASSSTLLSTSVPIDPAIPFRARRSVVDSAKEVYELLFELEDPHFASENDPLGDIRLANKLSFFFRQFDIPCEIHMNPKEELPVFSRGGSEILFFLAALCIKLSHIGSRNTVYLQPTPTMSGYLMDIVIPSLSESQIDQLREYTSALLGSYSEFPFAFGCENGVTKIRYYPLQRDESFFGLKRPGAND